MCKNSPDLISSLTLLVWVAPKVAVAVGRHFKRTHAPPKGGRKREGRRGGGGGSYACIDKHAKFLLQILFLLLLLPLLLISNGTRRIK